ncbi:MAG: NTP transferase domain-containing protein [Bacteroidales bacterium]|nr:NTP transferase domain-containing protein [Bacteroidales bacterium]
MERPLKTMIFAAGLGTRLKDITNDIPKALVVLNGKTALQIAVEKATQYGFGDIIVNIHHHAGLMRAEAERLNKLGYRITLSDESDLLLETGGGLYKAKWFFDERPFLIYNVDIITSLDINKLYKFHIEKNGIATLAVKNRPDIKYFLIGDNDLLAGWCNTSTAEEIIVRNAGELKKTGFSGIHIANPEIFSYMKEGIYSMTSFYLELARIRDIYAFKHEEDYWFNIGTPQELEEVRRFFSGE